ncbi:thiamine phosphate phosphatase-like protein [Bidens hawaiensis]|uniref:thiamine phosphate phosphatase-like protein n=1 Tax=Bidens hawaiensis TaxID=980011 RepID=UPI00404B3EF2
MIIVWDFDRTIINGDCDRWVVLEMGLTKLFHQLRTKFSWNQLMDKMMEELHSLGKTIDDFITRLNCFKMDPQMISAIRSAHDLGCEMKVLSNANQFFIETILKNNGIYNCFSEIITNPTAVNEDGRLRIFPYHGVDLPPHGCNFCPANLCKGSVIDRVHDSDVKKRGVIYVGDGKDDVCPSLKLREGEHVMARYDFILYHILSRATIPINPKLHYWKDGEELNNMLIQLLSPQAEV